MNRIEKVLNQRISSEIELNLLNYCFKYILKKDTDSIRTITKNQYQFISIRKVINKVKFPISISSDENFNLKIQKSFGYILPYKLSKFKDNYFLICKQLTFFNKLFYTFSTIVVK